MRNTRLKIAIMLTVGLALIGCTVTKLVETPPGSGVFKKTAETDPRVTKAIDTVGAVDTATAPFNPWHGLVGVLLAGAAGIAQWTKLRKQAQLDAVIAGVEAKGDQDVKTAIKEEAIRAGVETGLNKSVKALTGG